MAFVDKRSRFGPEDPGSKQIVEVSNASMYVPCRTRLQADLRFKSTRFWAYHHIGDHHFYEHESRQSACRRSALTLAPLTLATMISMLHISDRLQII